MLEIAGVEITRATEKIDYNGMKLAFGPKILLDPKCAITLADIRARFKGTCKITAGATLILCDDTV